MTALPEELISQLCDLITRLREESAAYQENHEDGQLWYNRGYANGMVKGLAELLADQQPCGQSLDDEADLQGHEVMAWGQAYRHGEQMGYKETFEIAGAEVMRIVSFNINGVRARPHQLEALRDTYDPDVIGLQETKVNDPDFPLEMIQEMGYHVRFYGQKSHYGVALLSKEEPIDAILGLPSDDDDAQRRLITGTYKTPKGEQLTVINGYFPQGESRDHETKFPHKKRFYEELQALLESQYSADQALMVIGDVNIAPQDADIGIGDSNMKRWLRDGKCSFLPEEREWFERLQGWGLHDTFRTVHPSVDNVFSWFDYRSKGFDADPKRGLRIDVLLATAMLNDKVKDAGVAYDLRGMEKPSDHAPIWVDLDI